MAAGRRAERNRLRQTLTPNQPKVDPANVMRLTRLPVIFIDLHHIGCSARGQEDKKRQLNPSRARWDGQRESDSDSQAKMTRNRARKCPVKHDGILGRQKGRTCPRPTARCASEKPNLTPNCMMRGAPACVWIRPKVPDVKFTTGLPQLKLFSRLNVSSRSSTFGPSPKPTSRDSARSTSQ